MYEFSCGTVVPERKLRSCCYEVDSAGFAMQLSSIFHYAIQVRDRTP